MRILTVGGGSGGHVTPIVAVLNELKRQLDNEQLTVSFVCDKAFEEQALEALVIKSMQPIRELFK